MQSWQASRSTFPSSPIPISMYRSVKPLNLVNILEIGRPGRNIDRPHHRRIDWGVMLEPGLWGAESIDLREGTRGGLPPKIGRSVLFMFHHFPLPIRHTGSRIVQLRVSHVTLITLSSLPWSII
jgi:hypothetical protein